jgi:phage FluMu protein Com
VEEIRCVNCGKLLLLIREKPPPTEIEVKCPRCKTINQIST